MQRYHWHDQRERSDEALAPQAVRGRHRNEHHGLAPPRATVLLHPLTYNGPPAQQDRAPDDRCHKLDPVSFHGVRRDVHGPFLLPEIQPGKSLPAAGGQDLGVLGHRAPRAERSTAYQLSSFSLRRTAFRFFLRSDRVLLGFLFVVIILPNVDGSSFLVRVADHSELDGRMEVPRGAPNRLWVHGANSLYLSLGTD